MRELKIIKHQKAIADLRRPAKYSPDPATRRAARKEISHRARRIHNLQENDERLFGKTRDRFGRTKLGKRIGKSRLAREVQSTAERRNELYDRLTKSQRSLLGKLHGVADKDGLKGRVARGLVKVDEHSGKLLRPVSNVMEHSKWVSGAEKVLGPGLTVAGSALDFISSRRAGDSVGHSALRAAGNGIGGWEGKDPLDSSLLL